MELQEYLSIVLTRWRVVAVAAILGGVVTSGLSLLATPTAIRMM